MDAIPHSKIAPSFLDSNAQAHHDILFAVADVLDNAREAGSTLVNIDVRSKGNPTRPTHQLVISDDGAGMCEAQMSEGVMSIAYTQKDLSTGQHYGMGSTTAVPRLCRGALCFSLTRNSHPTLGLLSSRLSAKLGATELVVPQVSWSALEPGAILEDAPRAGGPSKEPRTVSLTREARAASLKVILAHSPYSTEEQLIAEFRSIEAASATGTGTRWLMWDVDTHELELAKAADDVLVKNKQELWPHQRSLRGFLEVLYYVDDELLRRGAMMSIRIKGTPVTPRNWTTFLHHAQTVRHRPHNATTALAQATTRFGFQKPLAEVARLFGARSAGKNKHGSEYTAHTFTEDDVHFFTFGLTRVSYQKTHDYSGVFYYHKNRLTIALAPAALQKRGFTQMNTTEVRESIYSSRGVARGGGGGWRGVGASPQCQHNRTAASLLAGPHPEDGQGHDRLLQRELPDAGPQQGRVRAAASLAVPL